MYYPGVTLAPIRSLNSDNIKNKGSNTREQRKLSLPDIQRNKLK